MQVCLFCGETRNHHHRQYDGSHQEEEEEEEEECNSRVNEWMEESINKQRKPVQSHAQLNGKTGGWMLSLSDDCVSLLSFHSLLLSFLVIDVM